MQTIDTSIFDAIPSSKGRPPCDTYNQHLIAGTAFVMTKGTDYDIRQTGGNITKKWATEYQNLANAAKRKGLKVSYKTVRNFKIGDDIVAECALIKVIKG